MSEVDAKDYSMKKVSLENGSKTHGPIAVSRTYPTKKRPVW